jgi:transposase
VLDQLMQDAARAFPHAIGIWACRRRVADPFSGQLFIFRGKRGDYFKGLYWDGTGMWLIAKRLEKGRFVWPPIVDGAMTLTPAQFSVLIEAMDWRRTIAPPPPAQPMLV